MFIKRETFENMRDDLNALSKENFDLRLDNVNSKRDFANLQRKHVNVSIHENVKSERDMFELFTNDCKLEISILKDFISRQADMISRLINE